MSGPCSTACAHPPASLARYLIFFDDGYAAYVQHREVKLICQPSKVASDDVHPECRDFVAKYLAQFPERPMVKLQAGQLVKTEYNGG